MVVAALNRADIPVQIAAHLFQWAALFAAFSNTSRFTCVVRISSCGLSSEDAVGYSLTFGLTHADVNHSTAAVTADARVNTAKTPVIIECVINNSSASVDILASRCSPRVFANKFRIARPRQDSPALQRWVGRIIETEPLGGGIHRCQQIRPISHIASAPSGHGRHKLQIAPSLPRPCQGTASAVPTLSH